MKHFNICPICAHRNSCVLTAQKDKVWDCSEYDELQPNKAHTKTVQQPERELELV